MKRVLLDVDGVLADFLGAFRMHAERVCGRPMPAGLSEWCVEKSWQIDPPKLNEIWWWMNLPGVAFELEPLPHAVQAVTELGRCADVYFVTSPVHSSPTWAYDRERWLIKHFGEHLGRKTVFTRHKHTVVGDIFVDDKPSSVMAWQTKHPSGIARLWHAPGNESSFLPRLVGAAGWTELLDMAVRG